MVSSTPRQSDLRLSEYARKFVYPDGIERTVWPRVEAKGRDLGLGFDWWQSQLGTVCLGYGADGKYVASIGGVGMSIPRQVGKTYFVLALLVCLCILFPGLQVVWTAHHLRTSTKTFTALRGICNRKKVAPHVKAMRSANGEQQVEFTNGSMIMFGARSMGFGRGFDEIDVEVYDEAQILDAKALEDMVAATNQARHVHGALLFFMGTPPRPSDPSDAFSERRKEAWSGKSEYSIWLEIGADPDSSGNDESQWPGMNPSFPLRTPVESLLRLRKNLKDEDSWNREGRGIWDAAGISLFDEDRWDALKDAESKIVGPVRLGLAVAQDHSWTCISASGRREDGQIHVQVVEYQPGTRWAVEKLAELAGKKRQVALRPASPAGALITDLEKAGVKLMKVTATEYAQACGSFFKNYLESNLRHIGQRELDVSVRAAKKRSVGDAWMFDAKADLEISPLESGVVAVHATSKHKPRTSRPRVGILT